MEATAESGATGAVQVGNEPRSALLALTRQIEKNLPVAEAEMTANIRFAVTVRDSDAATTRDKLRAVEFLEAVRARGIDVAMYLDKAERPAAPPNQVNIAHAEGIVFNITPLPPKPGNGTSQPPSPA